MIRRGSGRNGYLPQRLVVGPGARHDGGRVPVPAQLKSPLFENSSASEVTKRCEADEVRRQVLIAEYVRVWLHSRYLKRAPPNSDQLRVVCRL